MIVEFLQIQITTERTSVTRTRAAQILPNTIVEICSTPLTTAPRRHKMCFNPDPDKQAVELLFSRKNTILQHPTLYFNNVHVHKQEKHKHLGLLLDTKLSFVEHVDEKVNKAYKLIGTLRFLSKHLPLHSLDRIYKMMIRSYVDYCDVIYHIPQTYAFPSTLNNLMEKLGRVQYNA